jgi:MFS superfamily sulfate permease-like transporter
LTTPGVSLIAFSFATGHKWLASGATSIAAVTVKADLASYQAEGSDYVSLVCLYSLMVGVASMLLALCRGGAVAKAIPKPVRIPSGCHFFASFICATSSLLAA